MDGSVENESGGVNLHNLVMYPHDFGDEGVGGAVVGLLLAALLHEEPVQDYFGLVLVMTLMLFSVKIPILLRQESLDGDDTLLGAADAEVLVGRDSGLGFGHSECDECKFDVTYI